MTKKEAKLVDVLRRNFLYQSPTPVLEDGRIARYNLTMFADDYKKMMGSLSAAGGFVMPPGDRERLIREFSEKARTAAGGYDLANWSRGELAAAYEDVKGIEELSAFFEAVGKEIKSRSHGPREQ